MSDSQRNWLANPAPNALADPPPARPPQSVMVDKAGKPLTMYHGTNSDFKGFNGPAYFTYDPEVAKGYASARRGAEGGRLISAHLDMRNPASSADLSNAVDDLGLDPHQQQPLAPFATHPDVVEHLKARGHDGVRDVMDFGYGDDFKEVPVVVPFHPHQISQLSSEKL